MALLKLDCQSSVKSQGKFVTQIIHFVGGEKRTFENIESEYIKQGQFTKLMTSDGRKKFEDLGFIGMHSINYTGGGNHMTIEPYDNKTNTGGWGCFIMFAKKHWVDIPEGLKIWYGDNFMQAVAYGRGIPVSQFRGLSMGDSDMSVTSDDMSVIAVRDNDTIEWHKILNNGK